MLREFRKELHARRGLELVAPHQRLQGKPRFLRRNALAQSRFEMRMLAQGLPALLHGAKVGVGTVIATGWYARLQEMSRAEAARRLAGASLPDAEAAEETIRRVYGPVADQIIAQQTPFFRMSPEQWSALKQRILDHWDDVQTIAARVPAPATVAAALRSAGGPATPQELGLSEAEARIAADYGHFTRPRFTIAKLRLLLGL
jgi:glycerol-1-phosphate dehydrogenase [NAD(P)+]